MSQKPKGVLDAMASERKSMLERWLFDDAPTLTYAQARARVKEEFKVETSERALSCFYRGIARERMKMRIAEKLGEKLGGRDGEGKRPADGAVFEALMMLSGKVAMDLGETEAAASIDEAKTLAQVAALGLRARRDEERVKLWQRGVELKETKYKDQLKAEAEKRKPKKRKGGLSRKALREIEREAKIM